MFGIKFLILNPLHFQKLLMNFAQNDSFKLTVLIKKCYCSKFQRLYYLISTLVLGKIYHELRKLHVNQNMGARNLPDLVDGTVSGAAGELTAVEVEARLSNSKSDRGGSRRKRKHSPDEVAGAAGKP